ncbi:Uncharacterised protein [Mycobacteroides abscessus]|nr:Uncharacterised protein [Mycobacteroides abscessus]
MLSPGWEYSAARNVSWKSSSRTATPFAQAAHSGLVRVSRPQPNTVAPGVYGCASAWPRAATAGPRVRLAAATAALSMTRLTTMSTTSGVTSTGSVASSASFHASWSVRSSGSALG